MLGVPLGRHLAWRKGKLAASRPYVSLGPPGPAAEGLLLGSEGQYGWDAGRSDAASSLRRCVRSRAAFRAHLAPATDTSSAPTA